MAKKPKAEKPEAKRKSLLSSIILPLMAVIATMCASVFAAVSIFNYASGGEKNIITSFLGGFLSMADINVTQEPTGFETYDYYIPENIGRYQTYRAANPAFSDSEVVWHVNMGLDGAQYVDYKTIEDLSANNYLVNKYNKLPDDYAPQTLVPLDDFEADSEAAAAFENFRAAAVEAGRFLSIVSAYRTPESQQALYDEYLATQPQEEVDRFLARPGFSEHQTGRAFDIAEAGGTIEDFAGTYTSSWVAKNCYKYGFIVRYPESREYITGYIYEPWHITYVGEEIALDMREKRTSTLEEYIAKYKFTPPPAPVVPEEPLADEAPPDENSQTESSNG